MTSAACNAQRRFTQDDVRTFHLLRYSGHGAVKENYFLDDGAYSAVQIIIEVVRRKLAGEADIMEQLLTELREPVESQEFRLKITVSGVDWWLSAEGYCWSSWSSW